MKTLKGCFFFSLIFLAFLILIGMPCRVFASPYISLETYSDWNGALVGGSITPVTTYYDALGYHYGTPGVDFIQVTPDLMALTDMQSGYGDGLLMYWGEPMSELPQVATWQYNYPMDPNLVGTTLNLTVMPPPGIQSVSLTINDAAGGWISWDWNVTAPGGLGPLFFGQQNLVIIDPNIFGFQGASSFAMNPLNGFNPAIATTIQADELAVGANQWNLFPQVPVVGGIKPWNYWGNLNVSAVPEPGTILFLGLGLAGLLGFNHLKKRKKI